MTRTDDLIALVNGITSRPRMFVAAQDYEQVVAYLGGYHSASGALEGFHEWLCMKFEKHYSVGWSLIVATEYQSRSQAAGNSETTTLLQYLCQLLVEFLRHRDTIGLRNIFYDHGKWRRSFEWFDENVERYGCSSGPVDKSEEQA